ncbi:MAG: TetR/AcrR family transcriptional regulator [Candidatus Dormibacteria bacterium]
MDISRQERSLKDGGRVNQRARTRTALLTAAGELLRQGQAPSMPEAAERALVSVATAYRYFPSAEELWLEAAVAGEEDAKITSELIAAAGLDPQARLEALIRSTGFQMLEDQVPYRRIAKGALDQWFRQQNDPEAEAVPVRQRRRNDQIKQVIAPLDERLPPDSLARIAHALGIVIGCESMISLVDAVGLDLTDAKMAMLDAARWLLNGALAELGAGE